VDSRDHYRAIVKRIIGEQAQIRPSHGDTEVVAICDEASDSYLVMVLGWSNDYRHHAAIIHLRLKDGKVWVEHDGTEDDIAGMLIAAGIPQADVVLAFLRPEEREQSEFAVA
jgi:hypothetical protein